MKGERSLRNSVLRLCLLAAQKSPTTVHVIYWSKLLPLICTRWEHKASIRHWRSHRPLAIACVLTFEFTLVVTRVGSSSQLIVVGTTEPAPGLWISSFPRVKPNLWKLDELGCNFTNQCNQPMSPSGLGNLSQKTQLVSFHTWSLCLGKNAVLPRAKVKFGE